MRTGVTASRPPALRTAAASPGSLRSQRTPPATSDIRGEPQPPRSRIEAPIQGPQADPGEPRRRQEMRVDPPNPGSRQGGRLKELEHLVVVRDGGERERSQQRQHLCTVAQVSAGKLTDHEWVGPDLSVVEFGGKGRVPAAEVLDPNRGVDQHWQRRLPPLSRSAPGGATQVVLAPAKRCEPPRALTRDERLQPRVDHRSLLGDPTEALSLVE